MVNWFICPLSSKNQQECILTRTFVHYHYHHYSLSVYKMHNCHGIKYYTVKDYLYVYSPWLRLNSPCTTPLEATRIVEHLVESLVKMSIWVNILWNWDKILNAKVIIFWEITCSVYSKTTLEDVSWSLDESSLIYQAL